ncbi:prostaglandin reductase 1 [Halyomorpha halys]|uniref:prostaglandin reductase 1 n=1 Tax=Halyomorpha halys TaxID=286706 RepID=UPI0006D509D7|nr:prostaglandin reductase 1-like [Halyomorpha halys]
MKCKKFIFKQHFDGVPKKSDFELVEEELPPLQDGDVLFEALYISVDPYMRPVSVKLPLGVTMIGAQVARVVESKHPDFEVGKNVVGQFGWRNKTVANPDTVLSGFGEKSRPYVLPDFGDIPLSTAIGVLGMPGNTAYFGLTRLCTPKKGETLVVTGASGAVGSLVGQIGKILGLNVIGFVGSDDKAKWLTEELNFDHAFNYKTCDIAESLKKAAPNGVDCYFDNVGGRISSAVLDAMNPFGRVACCGYISGYNADPKNPPLAPIVQPNIVLKQLKLEGFLSSKWKDCWFEGIEKNLQFIKEGKLKFKETIVKGFDKTDEAFISLFTSGSDNAGKVVVQV